MSYKIKRSIHVPPWVATCEKDTPKGKSFPPSLIVDGGGGICGMNVSSQKAQKVKNDIKTDFFSSEIGKRKFKIF